MENHPIPQDITGFQFKLIGNMTVKQFVYLAVGVVIAVFFLFVFPIPFFIGLIVAIISAGTGAAFAFVPIDGRPMDVMVANFFRALFSPTTYMYQKTGGDLSKPNGASSNATPMPIAMPPPTISNNQNLNSSMSIAPVPSPAPVPSVPPRDETDSSTQEKEKQNIEEELAKMQKQKEELEKHLSNLKSQLEQQKSKPPSTPQLITQEIPEQITPAPPAAPQLENLVAPQEPTNTFSNPTTNVKDQMTVIAPPIQSQILTPEPSQILSTPAPQPQTQPQTPPAPAQPSVPANPQPSLPPQNMPSPAAGGPPAPLPSAGLPIPEAPNLITGIIRDPRGNPLQNILVEVKDQEGNPVRAFKTNGLGRFASATSITNGKYLIIFEDPKGENKFDPTQVEAIGNPIIPLEIVSVDAREELRRQLFQN